MSKNKSLIVVDMQDQFLGMRSEYEDFYLQRREKLITGIRGRVIEALDKKHFIVNVTFGDSNVIPELQDPLLRGDIKQFRKSSDGLFLDAIFSQRLEGNSIKRTLVNFDKQQFSSIYPKRGTMGYPIKQLMLRGGSCDIVGVSTVECVLAVNRDFHYIAGRVRSKTRFRVIGELCMTSDPQLYGIELSQERINDLYDYYRLPHPVWNS